MTSVTDHYGIAGAVPFIDVDLRKDTALFVDPHRIRRSRTAYATTAVRCMDTFLDVITSAILVGDQKAQEQAQNLLHSFPEPEASRLGFCSTGSNGSGVREITGAWIWEELSGSLEPLVHAGILRQFDMLPIFVDGIGPDRTSDVTTRIVLGPLTDFTAQMMMQFPALRSDSTIKAYPVWDPVHRRWTTRHVELPSPHGGPLILIPLGWAAKSLLMSRQRFYRYGVLEYIQRLETVRLQNGRLVTPSKESLKERPELAMSADLNIAMVRKALAESPRVDLLMAFEALMPRIVENERRRAAGRDKPPA